MNKKLIVILIFVLVVGVVGVTVLFFSQENEEVSNVNILEINKGDSKNFEGGWVLIGSNQFEASFINIYNITEEKFDFEASAFSGSNQGDFSGTAIIDGNKGIFREEEFETEVIFIIKDDILTVEIIPSNAYGGIGVGFGGDYKKDLEIKKITLVNQGIIEENSEELFIGLVGNEEYKLFNETFQIISEEDDIDNIGARVYVGGVRGLFAIMEGIIMIIEDDKFIAALLYRGEEIRYYSNIEKFKKDIPLTVEKWREKFSSVPIVVDNF